jgi:hypothetical protein
MKLRASAVKVLGQIGERSCVPTLVRMLQDGVPVRTSDLLWRGSDWWDDWDVRVSAARSLGSIGDVSAVAPLIEFATKRFPIDPELKPYVGLFDSFVYTIGGALEDIHKKNPSSFPHTAIDQIGAVLCDSPNLTAKKSAAVLLMFLRDDVRVIEYVIRDLIADETWKLEFDSDNSSWARGKTHAIALSRNRPEYDEKLAPHTAALARYALVGTMSEAIRDVLIRILTTCPGLVQTGALREILAIGREVSITYRFPDPNNIFGVRHESKRFDYSTAHKLANEELACRNQRRLEQRAGEERS